MKTEGNIKVFCRFRPFNSRQTDNNPTRLHRINKNSQLVIKDTKSEDISFMFDHVFDMDSTQEDVFQKVGQPVLNNILDGFNGTILAYGQTSSGKTHTMQGYDFTQKHSRGIMPRIIEMLFAAIQKSPENLEFKLKISLFEIYLEQIRDLLDVSKANLKIRENKQGYYVQNLTQVYVSEKIELFRYISIAQKNRMTCATNMNEHSSRSHLIFSLTLNQTTIPDGASKTSKLFLIDLAGSEKVSKTGAQGKVLEQAKKINLSLTNLGKVIKTLSERGQKSGHIPYRDSRLTRILKDSLGGNSKTTLIVTCSPHQMHLPQTITTLRFGENAQKVKNKPKINRELTVQQLQKNIEKLQIEIKDKNQHVKFLQQHIEIILKSEVPTYKKCQIQAKLKKTTGQGIQNESRDIEESYSRIQQSIVEQGQLKIDQQVEQRIKILQQQLSNYQSSMKVEMDKYYQIKKEYRDLHDHLTQILSENIQLKEKQDEKQKKTIYSQHSLSNNVILVRTIIGEILSSLDQQTRQNITKSISKTYWYEKIMDQGCDCVDYWQKQRQKLKKEVQSHILSNSTIIMQAEKSKQDEKIEKQNEIIAKLQEKLQFFYEGYESMMAHQTQWKAQCQLYERNLRKKQEKILQLEKQVEKLQQLMQEMYIYQQNDDTISVKSNNKIVKPLRGGFLIR